MTDSYKQSVKQQSSTDAQHTNQKWSREEARAVQGLAMIGKIAYREDYKASVARMKMRDQETKQVISGFAEIGRVAQREEIAAHRRRLRDIADEKKARMDMARSIGGGIAGAGSRALGTMSRAAGVTVGLLGGVSIAGAVQKAIEQDTIARGIAVRAKPLDGETRSLSEITTDTKKMMLSEQHRTGIAATEQGEMISNLLRRGGDFKATEQLLPFLNDLNDATGNTSAEGRANIGDTAGTVLATLRAKGITGEEGIARTKGILNNAAFQGLSGQLGPEELSQLVGKIAASANTQGGDFDKNVGSMFAMANVALAGGGAASVEEAGTAAMRATSEMYKHKKKLAAIGVNDAFDKQGTLRPLQDILPEILEKSKGNYGTLDEIFGDRGIKVIGGYAARYRNATDKPAELKKITEEIQAHAASSLTPEQIKQQAEHTRQGDERQMQIAFGDLEKTIAKDLVPVLIHDVIPAFVRLGPYIGQAADMFAKYLQSMAEHPISTLIETFGALLLKDLAAQGIGFAVKEALVKLLSTEAMGAVGGGLLSTMPTFFKGGKGSLLEEGAELGSAGSRLGGAVGKGLGVLGVAGLAYGAWSLAADQNDELKKETGGLGMWDIAKGMWNEGTWDPAKVVDKHMNEQAKEEAKKEASTSHVHQNPANAAIPAHLEKSSNSLDRAAKSMEKAAEHLARINRNGPVGTR